MRSGCARRGHSAAAADGPDHHGALLRVEVEFLPSGKKTKALLGQKFKVIAQQAKVQIPYSCERGDCGTCSVKFKGKIVKACQVSLPAASKEKSFQIEV